MHSADATATGPLAQLLRRLQALEVELHHPGMLGSPQRLEELLHPDFHEVGRSGRAYTRQDVIRSLLAQPQLPRTESSTFALRLLADNCALLTYRSVHRDADGSIGQTALRSSIWLRAADASAGWQLYYHQGTPAFDAS